MKQDEEWVKQAREGGEDGGSGPGGCRDSRGDLLSPLPVLKTQHGASLSYTRYFTGIDPISP